MSTRPDVRMERAAMRAVGQPRTLATGFSIAADSFADLDPLTSYNDTVACVWLGTFGVIATRTPERDTDGLLQALFEQHDLERFRVFGPNPRGRGR